ncbi:hypothetical protein Aph01nite_70620 [Acrocarpospora phusangensis]|uniref:Uncharacterized protein n=1 Tax=Acrocarpospora phusangensis TaxID=1070424 RepID=A0A919QMA8_9ACTN|nr:hypothetical protein Aph01nite_70620 [Acrocarpospora phusangensis]
MRGSAFVTTVLEIMATNIASSNPDRASRISRWVIWSGTSEPAAAKDCASEDTHTQFIEDKKVDISQP